MDLRRWGLSDSVLPRRQGGGLCLSNASQGWLLQEGFREQNYSLRVFRWSKEGAAFARFAGEECKRWEAS